MRPVHGQCTGGEPVLKEAFQVYNALYRLCLEVNKSVLQLASHANKRTA